MIHEILINDLRNIKYDQIQRHETALQRMCNVKNKMSKEHHTEVRGLRGKYENTLKDHAISIRQLIRETGLLSAEHEKVVGELREEIMVNIMYSTIK